MKDIFKKLVIGSLVTSAALAILAIVFEIDSNIGGQILLSTIIIFPFSTAGLCCSSIYDKPNLKWLSTIGIVVCITSCLYYLGLIWGIFDLFLFWSKESSIFNWQIILTTALLPACLAQISLLLSNDCTKEPAKTIQKVTAILSIIITILLLDSIWTKIIEYNDILSKLVIIALILIAVGTLLTRILSRPNKKLDIVKDIIDHNIMDDIDKIEQTCPNCKQTINPEWKFCPNCNTQLKEEKKLCPSCNNQIEKEWKFCPNGNANLEPKEKQSE